MKRNIMILAASAVLVLLAQSTGWTASQKAPVVSHPAEQNTTRFWTEYIKTQLLAIPRNCSRFQLSSLNSETTVIDPRGLQASCVDFAIKNLLHVAPDAKLTSQIPSIRWIQGCEKNRITVRYSDLFPNELEQAYDPSCVSQRVQAVANEIDGNHHVKKTDRFGHTGYSKRNLDSGVAGLVDRQTQLALQREMVLSAVNGILRCAIWGQAAGNEGGYEESCVKAKAAGVVGLVNSIELESSLRQAISRTADNISICSRFTNYLEKTTWLSRSCVNSNVSAVRTILSSSLTTSGSIHPPILDPAMVTALQGAQSAISGILTCHRWLDSGVGAIGYEQNCVKSKTEAAIEHLWHFRVGGLSFSLVLASNQALTTCNRYIYYPGAITYLDLGCVEHSVNSLKEIIDIILSGQSSVAQSSQEWSRLSCGSFAAGDQAR